MSKPKEKLYRANGKLYRINDKLYRDAILSNEEAVYSSLLQADQYIEQAEALLQGLDFNGKSIALDKLEDLRSFLLGRMRRQERLVK